MIKAAIALMTRVARMGCTATALCAPLPPSIARYPGDGPGHGGGGHRGAKAAEGAAGPFQSRSLDALTRCRTGIFAELLDVEP